VSPEPTTPERPGLWSVCHDRSRPISHPLLRTPELDIVVPELHTNKSTCGAQPALLRLCAASLLFLASAVGRRATEVLVPRGTKTDVTRVTSSTTDWHPQTVLRWIRAFPSSTTPALVDTDCGEGYLKALGNPQGPHALACELVGTTLARRMGLRTLEFAIITVADEDEIPLGDGRLAKPGPAFITKVEKAATWGGKDRELKMLVNPEDISRLVVFDTWVLNFDRCYPDQKQRHPNYDNVFLSGEDAPEGQFVLKAIDHTHCFDRIPNLTPGIARIGRVKDARVYGRFPGFEPFIKVTDVARAVAALKAITKQDIEQAVASVPPEWQVDIQTRQSLVDLVWRRASFVAENIMEWLGFLAVGHGFVEGGTP